MSTEPVNTESMNTEQTRQAEPRSKVQRDGQQQRVMQVQIVPVTMLWFGVLGGPLAWFMRLIISYALVPVVCVQDWPLAMHAVSATLFVITLAAALVAGRASQKLRSAQADRAHQSSAVETFESWTGQRAYFMAHLGLLLSTLFAAVILVEWAATFFISPCVVR